MKSYTWVVLALILASCSQESMVVEDDPTVCEGTLCDPEQIQAMGLDPFYQKILFADGIPILSSEKVEDRAHVAAQDIILHMLSERPDVKEAMIERKARVGIMDDTEVTTDIPEHRHLANDPNVDWDTRARGLGGTPGNPITTAGEENLLCLPGDVFAGESILVHEFAHGIHLLGIAFVDPGFNQALRTAYDEAVRNGLWANTYAQTNEIEYWAEGVQSWFNANQGPQPGIHNEVNTREELKAHDPLLYALIDSYMPDDDWQPAC